MNKIKNAVIILVGLSIISLVIYFINRQSSNDLLSQQAKCIDLLNKTKKEDIKSSVTNEGITTFTNQALYSRKTKSCLSIWILNGTSFKYKGTPDDFNYGTYMISDIFTGESYFNSNYFTLEDRKKAEVEAGSMLKELRAFGYNK